MSDVPKVALLIETHAGYGRGVLRGIARYIHLHAPWVIHIPSEDVFPGELTLPRDRAWSGNGIIGRLFTRKVVDEVLAAAVPTIGMDLSAEQLAEGHPLSQVSELCPDSRAAGRMAAEHFLERGFRHFAFCGYAGQIWSQHRQEGFCQRVAEAGFSSSVYQSPRRRRQAGGERERSHIISWLQSLPHPLGLMACNDQRGRQALEACLVAGLHVPDDVAVVGADDDRLLCELSNPPLSSITFNAEKGGYQAAELLDGLMSGRVDGPRRILVEPLRVVTRRSSDSIALEDRHVVRALRFIRDSAQTAIQVDDVAAHSGIGRRALEIRFHKAIGRSIRREIQETHLAWAKRLLAETELPLARIAELSGFSSLSYLSNVFRRHVEMTPAKYRRHTRPE